MLTYPTRLAVLTTAVAAAVLLLYAATRRVDDATAVAPIPRSWGFVSSGGERIYYETAGRGDAVVLCHGAGGNHVVWYQQVPVLARSFRVITWDQRGFGRSSNESESGGPSVAVADLRRVLDHLGVDRAHVIGQSMGGWTALGFAVADPQRVRSLVLADTTGGISTPAIEAAIDAYIAAAVDAPPPEDLPLGHHPGLDDGFIRRDPARAFLYQELASLREPVFVGGQVQKNTAYPREAIGGFRFPILFIVGSRDRIFPPKLIRQAAALAPNARVIEIAGAGHSPYFEKPESWNAAVLAFLGDAGEP